MVQVASRKRPSRGKGGEVLGETGQRAGAGRIAEVLDKGRLDVWSVDRQVHRARARVTTYQRLGVLRLHRLGDPDHGAVGSGSTAGGSVSTPSTTSGAMLAATACPASEGASRAGRPRGATWWSARVGSPGTSDTALSRSERRSPCERCGWGDSRGRDSPARSTSLTGDLVWVG